MQWNPICTGVGQKNLKKYNRQVKILLCSSVPYKQTNQVLDVLDKSEVEDVDVFMIDSEMYKDKKSDNRQKGFLFRNDICEACRNDLIGVPYKIHFNKERKIIAKGYPSKVDMELIIDSLLK